MMPYPVIANLENPILWIGIILVIFLIFGNKLPQMMRGLGSSVSEFKKGIREGEESSTTETVAAPEKEKAKAAPEKKEPAEVDK